MLGKKGFTLVELLIVIIIVGILAAVSVPIMRGNLARARGTEGVAAAGSIRTAQRIYYAEHDYYANSLADLDLDADELGGKYFGGAGNIAVSNSAGDFNATVSGIGDSAGDSIIIYGNGDITENYS